MAANERAICIPYTPRPLQREFHENLKRWNLLVCHRRFGKTVLEINELVKGALTNTLAMPRYAYLAPQRNQAKSVAWDYLKHFTRDIPGVDANESELRVDFPNGGRVTLYGCDKPDKLRGIYLDGCALDEYAQMPSTLLGEVIRPALSDRRGYAIFSGTPKGKNAFFDLYHRQKDNPDWLVRLYKASETGIIPDEELRGAKSMMTEDEYAQEYECSWTAAIRGAYYDKMLSAAESEGRLTSIGYDEGLRVYTAWDLGMSDATAIGFFQAVGNEFRCIDYYQASGEGLAHYAKVLQDKPYIYAEHFAPHDIRVRELGTGVSRWETAQSLGIEFTIVPQIGLQDGIDAVRRMFPRLYFNKPKTGALLDALWNYAKEWDDSRGDFRAKPKHNWTSHGADMLRYFAVGIGDNAADSSGTMVQWGGTINYSNAGII